MFMITDYTYLIFPGHHGVKEMVRNSLKDITEKKWRRKEILLYILENRK